MYIKINTLLNHRRPVGETGFKRKTIPDQHQRTIWWQRVVKLKVGSDHFLTTGQRWAWCISGWIPVQDEAALPSAIIFKVLAVYMEGLKKLPQKEEIQDSLWNVSHTCPTWSISRRKQQIYQWLEKEKKTYFLKLTWLQMWDPGLSHG